MRTIRILLATALFLVTTTWPRQARADVTINGIVGDVAVVRWSVANQINNYVVRIKLTDVNQTANCLMGNNPNAQITKGYAYFYWVPNPTINDPPGREWLSLLLYSKKGAPISITLINSTDACQVTGVILP